MTTASVFTGVKLGNDSRTLLLDTARRFLGDLNEKVKGQHLVLKFRGSPDKIPKELMGSVVDLEMTGLRSTGGVQVALVRPKDDTLAAKLGMKVSAYILVASNAHVEFVSAQAKALARREPEDGDIEFEHPLVLRGEVGFVHDRMGWVFSHLDNKDMVPQQ